MLYTIPHLAVPNIVNYVNSYIQSGGSISIQPLLGPLVSPTYNFGLLSPHWVEAATKSVLNFTPHTATSAWMDGTLMSGLSVGNHRIGHGHFLLTDGAKAFSNPALSTGDFLTHMATDVVTKNGIPLLPYEAIHGISDFTSISINKLSPWLSVNIVDIASGGLSLYHAGSNVQSIVNGTNQWGVQYAFDTFGVGAVELTAGAITQNPLLVVAGGVDVTCGAITAYQYYSQPFILGVPLSEILSSVMLGQVIGIPFIAVELYIKRNQMRKQEMCKLAGKRASLSLGMSTLAAISTTASMTASIGIVAFMAIKQAEQNVRVQSNSIPTHSTSGHILNELIIDSSKDSKMKIERTEVESLRNIKRTFTSMWAEMLTENIETYKERVITRADVEALEDYAIYEYKKDTKRPIPVELQAGFDVAKIILDNDKERSKNNTKLLLSSLGTAGSIGVFGAALGSILNPGLWAGLVAIIAGGIAASPVAIGLAAISAVGIGGSIYGILQTLSPKNRTEASFKVINDGFNKAISRISGVELRRPHVKVLPIEDKIEKESVITEIKNKIQKWAS